MTARSLAMLAGATLMLAGCPKPGPPVAAPASGSPPVSTAASKKKNVCLAEVTTGNTCRRPPGGGKPVCRLVAFGAGTTGVVYPYRLHVGQHGPNREVTIIWELVGVGEEFVAASNDGPVQLVGDPRFSNAWVAAQPDGAASAASGKYFRIDFKNDADAGTAGIEYDLQFTDAAQKSVKCDPNITNQSG